MRARLEDRRLQVIVFTVLAVTIVYNVVRFSGRKPRELAHPFFESGTAIELTVQSPPNWASGQYDVPADWGRNPFAGGKMAEHSQSSLSSEMEPGPAGH